MHGVHQLPFLSLTSERWDSLPDRSTMKQQIAAAALANCEVSGTAYGLYTPPHEIREVKLTDAAMDQIRSMWHGHRKSGRGSPPPIPLKVFVVGFGQKDGHTWASIEILPGIDNWEAPE
jgi:hypothetical protein